jgi:two-component system sensor histidine kinase/response regulator
MAQERFWQSEEAAAEKAHTAEKNVAVMRLAIVLFNAGVLFFVMDWTHIVPWLASFVVVTSIVYSLWVLLFQPYRRFPVLVSSYFTSVSDAVFILLCILGSGGIHSPFYVLWYASLAAIAFRYSYRETMLAALLYGCSYVAVLAALGQVPGYMTEVLVRTGHIFFVAALGGCLAREAYQQTRNKVELQHLVHRLDQKVREHTRTEEALRESEERYRQIFENASDGIFLLDRQARFIAANQEFARLTGLPKEEILGKTSEIFLPGKFAQSLARLERIIQEGRLGPYELEITTPMGTRVLSLNAFAYLRGTTPVGIMNIARDITAQKQTEKALQQAKEAAESANRAKSEFLANMSHEIRTPMNGVLGMTELLLDTELTLEQREYATTVHSSAEALLSLLNDILDFSKIEARKLELEHTDFSLRESLGDAIKTLALRAHQKGLELLYEVMPEVPDIVVGDPARLRQVTVNLVGNAIKFTERGEISLQVDKEEESEGKVHLHFMVTDTGIGISPEQQQLIFAAFSQADTSTTRRYGGTGLGLAISKQLVELMEGKMWVESQVGRGSTFHFTVRLDKNSAQTVVLSPPIPELSGLRVLVVDDNATNRCILQRLLYSWQMQPVLASSAQEAFFLMQKAAADNRPFSLVLTDVHMPEVDGFMFVQQIRANAALTDIPLLMLTSADQQGDRGRCQELGIAGYLLKPVRPSELLGAILRALGQQQETRMKPYTEPRKNQQALDILLAEDNVVNQKLAVHLLKKWGHQVTVAGTGKEALAALDRHSFDLVLMDVQMPEMDGIEATKAIRNREKGIDTHIPIIAMTAHAMQGDREQCLAAGMDGYVTKPLQTKHLFVAIERVCCTKWTHPPLQLDPAGTEHVDQAVF